MVVGSGRRRDYFFAILDHNNKNVQQNETV